MTNFQKKLKGNYGLGTYFTSWSSNWNSSSTSQELANIPNDINIVYLCYVIPDCKYIKNSNTWVGTGLDFSSDFSVIKGAIKIIKDKGTIVMLTVGGAVNSFSSFEPKNIADLMIDLGCDGVDLDWEDPKGNLASNELGTIIKSMRNNMKENALLSLAAFSVGAYGLDEFSTSLPINQNTGMCITGIKDSGELLDWINIMSYDAGGTFDPIIAFKAYRKYYSGPLMIGVEVPPEAWGGNIITLDKVSTYVNCILDDEKSNNGIFVWSYQKNGRPSCSDIINQCIKVFNENPHKVVNGWQSGVNYSAGCSVTHNGETYLCTTEHVSTDYCSPGVTLWINKNKIETKSLPLSPKRVTEDWKENIAYTSGKIVTYNSKLYKCIIPHTSIPAWNPEIESACPLWKYLST